MTISTTTSTTTFASASLTNAFSAKAIAGICCLVAFAALSGCGKKEDGQTVGQGSSSSMSSSERSARDSKTTADMSISKPADSSVAIVQNNASAAGNSTSKAMGNSVDDMAITASISAGFAKDGDLSAIKIDVDTKNGVVSLVGPAPSTVARDRATTIAKAVKGVTSVDNKLVVKGN